MRRLHTRESLRNQLASFGERILIAVAGAVCRIVPDVGGILTRLDGGVDRGLHILERPAPRIREFQYAGLLRFAQALR